MIYLSRRKIQIVLGVLWVLDGLLQLQPKMFTSAFMTQVIEPAQAGQPFFVHDPIQLGINIFLLHPAVFNSFIVITQLAIGLLILFKQTTKYGLWLSILWGAFVWYIGEAAAGLFSGHSSLLIGLPGAVLIYAVIALAVIPRKDDDKKPADHWLVFVWSIIWVVGTLYQLLPGQNSVNWLRTTIKMNASGAPSWLAFIDNHVATLLNHLGANMAHSQSMMNSSSGYLFIGLIACLQLFIGLGVYLSNNFRQLAIILGIILSLFYWIVGQSLGGYYS